VYRKISKGWFKHWDFELADLICIELAFFLAYYLRHKAVLGSTMEWYFKLGAIMLLIQCAVMMFGKGYKGILQRGYGMEFLAVIRHVTVIEVVFVAYEFIMKQTATLSRFVILMSWALGVVFCYLSRILIKHYVIRRLTAEKNQSKMLVVTTEERALHCMHTLVAKKIRDYRICGIALDGERPDIYCIGRTSFPFPSSRHLPAAVCIRRHQELCVSPGLRSHRRLHHKCGYVCL